MDNSEFQKEKMRECADILKVVNLPVIVFTEGVVLILSLNKGCRKSLIAFLETIETVCAIEAGNGEVYIRLENGNLETTYQLVETISKEQIPKGIIIFLSVQGYVLEVRVVGNGMIFMTQEHNKVVIDGDKKDELEDIEWLLSDISYLIVQNLHDYCAFGILPTVLSVAVSRIVSYYTVVERILSEIARWYQER
ncbi:MAG: hypothetical protein ACOX0R_02905 [Candidatus Dojkabacteria bacterium]|jgi:hypothetical protein